MGYPHITDLNLSHDPFNNTKPNNFATAPSPCHLLALNHADLASNASERSDKAAELSELQPLGSSRWNPTPEQLLALEELYRRGTRTPSAAQIQQIATRLRRFGKIEGKNVFYWFQNHKARERQKRRRQQPPPPKQQPQCDQSLENKESSGSVTTGLESEQTKNKGPTSNFSELQEQFISTHGVAAAATAKSGPNEWIQIQEELQLIKSRVGRAMVESQFSPIYLLNSMSSSTTTTSSDSARAMNTRNLCSIKPHHENITTLEDENREDQTLELFPLGSNGINISKRDTQVPIRAINTTFNPNQYIEFLPLKN
ncbi:hypothetical protein PTKIN_Ptkin17bG0112100 [Pterospermum kingtungense]